MVTPVPGVARAQVVLQGSSGKPEDRYVNTFHFLQNAGSSPIADETFVEIATRLIAFYNTAGPSGNMIAKYISSDVLRTTNSAQVRMYDLAEPDPRPLHLVEWQLGAVTDPGRLPGEVAVVGSFYGSRNIARKRGRIFLGPLNQNAIATNTARPHAGFITTIAEAMHTLAYPAGGLPLASWCVLSMVAGPVVTVVENGWCDDSFDTQRRRGIEASARTVFTGP